MIPVLFTWDGESMVAQRRFQTVCDKQFVVGEVYPMIVQEPRSQASHNHYFASIEAAWLNLPEDIAEQFPSSEHLRKYALIKAGFADERSIVCASKAEALRIASFIKPMDHYAIVVVSEATIKVYTAQSQSNKAMGKKVFQGSKDAVLDVIARLVGTDRHELARNAEQAA